jgi:hypothetical protein
MRLDLAQFAGSLDRAGTAKRLLPTRAELVRVRCCGYLDTATAGRAGHRGVLLVDVEVIHGEPARRRCRSSRVESHLPGVQVADQLVSGVVERDDHALRKADRVAG